MLFVLTGNVQIGKTRWLECLIADISTAGVTPYGVIAPGVWADRRDNPDRYPHADANGFEKLGIDNVLLPSGERIAFARREDLAFEEGTYDPTSQSAQAHLAWHITDDAVRQVNDHFSSLRTNALKPEHGAQGILIVDELGRLELERDQGLTEAVRLLEQGPSSTIPHALIVVREALLPCIESRFANWGQRLYLSPNNQARETVLDAVVAKR